MRIQRPPISCAAGAAALWLGLQLLTSPQLSAGTYQTDFNAGLPAGMNLYGTAAVDSGFLKLTTAVASQNNSSAIIDDFDAGETIAGFDATFKLYIGSGNGADGFSFYFGDFADAGHTEEGPGTIRGLSIVFDVYNNGGTPAEAPAIDVKWDTVTVFHRLVGATGTTTPASPLGTANTIRTQTTAGGAPVWWPVKIHVDTDGTLDVAYNNIVVVTNFPIFRTLTDWPIYGPAYRFGLSARTGGSYDNHWVDDLAITTYPVDAKTGQPFIKTIAPVPVGVNAGAAGGVAVEMQDGAFSVDQAKITMKYGATTVTPTITRVDNVTRIAYFGTGGILPVGKVDVNLAYETTSTPPLVNDFTWTFVVDPYATIPGGFPVASVDTSKPGFNVRLHQMDTIRAPGNDQNQTIMAERQLALGYSDPTAGEPYPNTADLSAAEPDGTFIEPGVLNYNYRAPAAVGNFSVNSVPAREDKLFFGIPGSATATEANYVAEITTILQLKQGGHRFGVNSDDGFRVSFGPGFDAPSPQIVGQFNGGRGSADTLFDLVMPADGFYPVRLSYWQGGGDANLEFFWVDPSTGQKVLVNDPDNLNAPRAYRASLVSRPSVTRVLPVQNWIGAFPDQDVVVEITDGGYAVAGTVSLLINNAPQTVTVSKTGKVTTLQRQGSVSNLLPSGLNTVQVVYGYDEGGTAVTLTNTYSFTVAPYYGVLPPNNRITGVTDPGFRARVHQMDKSLDANQGNGARINGGSDSNRMPWPEVQLSEGMINPTNGLPYPNLAKVGANNYLYDFEVINWQYNNAAAAVAQSGWFRTTVPAFPLLGANSDVGVPGLPGAGTSYGGLENMVMEITAYLELTRGVHVFGFNSDDGFVAISAPDVHDTLGTLVGFYNGGRGNSATMVTPVGQNPPVISPYVSSGSTLFSVIVPEEGIYPFRILYWQGGTGINAEFFSVNKANGAPLLIGDTANGGIPAYRTYTGPARPYVKFSICPTSWDGAYQQVGPGPIKMIGRTRNAVNSSDIYNYPNTGAGIIPRPWPNVAIGGVLANAAGDPNIKLLLNGAEVPATKTASGTDLTVAYTPDPPLPSGSTNTASLVYAGTTNSWTFVVMSYTSLNEADALPLNAAQADARGFRVKLHKLAAAPANVNQVPTAERQLAGELGANVAMPGPEADGAFLFKNIVNWNNNVNPNRTGAQIGNFQAAGSYGAGAGWPFATCADEPVPGVPNTTTNPAESNTDYLAAEVFTYLEFPAAGYYRLGVNSDDGFGIKVGTPGVTNGLQVAAVNVGKGSADIPVFVGVPKAGLYPIRLVWFNGTGGANLEFFSYDASGNKVPINDSGNPAALKAYYAAAPTEPPNITSVTASGGSIVIVWIRGGTLESAPTVLGPWTSTGNSSGTFTEPLDGAKFYRVKR